MNILQMQQIPPKPVPGSPGTPPSPGVPPRPMEDPTETPPPVEDPDVGEPTPEPVAPIIA